MGPDQCGYIRIHHECKGGIEKSVQRITDWHHEACLVITIGDREGQIFLCLPHMNSGLFFLLTTKFRILYCENMKKGFQNILNSLRYDMVTSLNITMTSRIDVRPAFGRRAAVHFYLSHGLVQVELYHMLYHILAETREIYLWCF